MKSSREQLPLEYELQFQPQLHQFYQKLKELGLDQQHHIRIPLCIDKSKEANKAGGMTKQQFQAFVDFIESLGIRYTIYLVPNDKEAYHTFQLLHQETIHRIQCQEADLDLDNQESLSDEELAARKIILIDKWRHSNQWQAAAKDYEALRHSQDKKLKVEEALSKSVEGHLKGHSTANRSDTASHLLLETKDYVSWLKKTDDVMDSSLVYPHSRPPILQHADTNAGLMNRIPHSLPHFKYFFMNPLAKLQQATSLSQPLRSSRDTKRIDERAQEAVPSPDDFVVEMVSQLMQHGTLNESNIGRVMASFYLELQKNAVKKEHPQAFAKKVVLKLIQCGKLDEHNIGQVLADFYLKLQGGVTPCAAKEITQAPDQREQQAILLEDMPSLSKGNMCLFPPPRPSLEIKKARVDQSRSDCYAGSPMQVKP